MVRLAVGINTYNDGPGLERCIRSLEDGVDKVIVVDGKYPGYGKETDPKFSTDNTKQICKQLADQKIVPEIQYVELFADQPVKRSKYLELANDCDFLLVVDSDEYIIRKGLEAANFESFRQILETSSTFELRLKDRLQYVHNIEVRTEPRKTLMLGKLIYRPSELYYSNHWRLNRRSDKREQRYPPMNAVNHLVRGIVMAYDERMRPPERMQVDVDYQWELVYKEGDTNMTREQFNNAELKQKFMEHNIHEARVWEETEEAEIESEEYQRRRWLEQSAKRRPPPGQY